MKKWLSDFPTTQAFAVAVILLDAVVTLVLLGRLLGGRDVQVDALVPLLTFVGGLNAVEGGRFIGKRATYKGEGTGP